MPADKETPMDATSGGSPASKEGEEAEGARGANDLPPETLTDCDLTAALRGGPVQVVCPGYSYGVEGADAGFIAVLNYPFAIHGRDHPSPQWRVSCDDGGVHLHVLKTPTSPSCIGTSNGTPSFPAPCNVCADLQFNSLSCIRN